MPTPFENIRRIEDLERRLAADELELRNQSGRLPRQQGKRWQFLVQTVADAADVPTYPTSGDTFKARFLDIAWEGTPGLSAYTNVPRSANWQAVIKNVAGQHLPVGWIGLATFHPPPPGTTGKGKWIVVDTTQEQIVSPNSGSSLYPAGSLKAPVNGYHRGNIRMLVGGIMTSGIDCFIRFVDDHDNTLGNVPAFQQDHYGPGRPNGTATVGLETLPVYTLRSHTDWFLGILSEDLEQGASATMRIWAYWLGKWRDTQIDITVYDWFLPKEETIDKKTKVRADRYGQIFVVTAAGCQVDDVEGIPSQSTFSPGMNGEELGGELGTGGGDVDWGEIDFGWEPPALGIPGFPVPENDLSI